MTIDLESFKKSRILVIGDVMLDKYLFGDVERISPEAPVPVVAVREERFVPGGAANAASNVASLGGSAVLLGLVGADAAADILKEEVGRHLTSSLLITHPSRPTIQKIRVLGQHQQLLRIDYEDKAAVDGEMASQLIAALKSAERADAILVSDYAKGVVSDRLMEVVKERAKAWSAPLLIDPKPAHKALYRGAALITPNRKETEEMTGMVLDSDEQVAKAAAMLQRELGCDVLITLGERGMALCQRGKDMVRIGTLAKEVYDVSGAGDTVIATLGLALAAGADVEQAARLANVAAGIKVGKVGTAAVTVDELRQALR